MWYTYLHNRRGVIHLIFKGFSRISNIGPITVVFGRRNKPQEAALRGVVLTSQGLILIQQIDDSTHVALLDQELDDILHQYGGLSSVDQPCPAWHGTDAVLIGLNNVNLCSPAQTREMAVKLADARQYVLNAHLKNHTLDIIRFGYERPCLDQISMEAYRTALHKVLVSMIQTYFRFGTEKLGGGDGPEQEHCLTHVDVKAEGWRIRARRCIDNDELDLMVLWDVVGWLPGFQFDDSNFDGCRPVTTWDWYSSHDKPPGSIENGLTDCAETCSAENASTILGDQDDLEEVCDKLRPF